MIVVETLEGARPARSSAPTRIWIDIDDARDQLRTIYAQTLDQTNGACKQASQQ